MNDQAPGNAWDQPPANPQTAAPARPPRQKRQPRITAASKPVRTPKVVPPPSEAAPAPKKPRKAKTVERAAPETIKVSLKEFAQMRVGADDAKLFLKLHGLLSLVSKGTRAKVLGELQKVFG